MFWLKKCVMSLPLIEAILVDIVYPVVLLAHKRPLSLLPMIFCCLQLGLCICSTQFCKVKEITNKGVTSCKTPNCHIEMPHLTDSMVCVALSQLMSTPSFSISVNIPYMEWYKCSIWNNYYKTRIRKIINHQNYHIFLSSPTLPNRVVRSSKTQWV